MNREANYSQKEEQGGDKDVYKKLVGGVEPEFIAPDADHKEHWDQGQLIENIEDQKVPTGEYPYKHSLRKQKPSVVFP